MSHQTLCQAGEFYSGVTIDFGTGDRRVVPAGDSVHTPDTPADRIYFIHDGEVRVLQSGPNESSRLVEILGPGQWFGVAALAGATTCQTQASAVSPVIVSEMTVDTFYGVLRRDADCAVAFVKELAARLQTARADAGQFVFDDCQRRILKTLIAFSNSAAATNVGPDVSLRITHQQLAQAVGVARETVSVALTKLRRQHLVHTGRNRLTFSPKALTESVRRLNQPAS